MKVGSNRNYLLGLLLVILAFNYVDRLALGILLQDIKKDLSLSDTQLGLLTGLAFAVFYSLMGMPIARWADRGNRVTIISLTTLVWSAAVALCGQATSFLQLLIIRAGVAVGEAGAIPPAHSLIADYFDRSERPRAVATYMLGGPLSALIGYFGAGWLNQFFGWRLTFLMLGLPGVFLALIAAFTLKEPRLAKKRLAEARPDQPKTASVKAPPLSEVTRTLFANRSFRNLLLCFSIVAFFNYGIVQWKPAFFARSFGLHSGELGTWFALIYGASGLFGTILGGELATRFAANKERLQLKTMALAYVAFALTSAGVYFSHNLYLSLFLNGLSTLGAAATIGPLFATVQTLIPERMRAVSIAALYLFANLIGLGLGPLAVGAISDGLRAMVGVESLRYALLALTPGYVWAALHLWRASQTIEHDLQSAAAASAPDAVTPALART